MTLYVNNASTPLLLDTYRAVVPYEGYFKLSNDVQRLAGTHGGFGKLAGQTFSDKKRNASITLSGNPGYLAGNIVRDKFDNDNLLYCEQVDADGTSIIVATHDRELIIDTLVPPGRLPDRVVARLFATNKKYDVVLCGTNTPIDWVQREGAYVIHPNQLASSKRAEQGVLLELRSVHARYRVLPVKAALRKSGLHPLPFWRPLVAAAVLAALTVVFMPKDEVPVDPLQPAVIDHYAKYRQDLSSESPAGNVLAALFLLGRSMTLPGWDVTSVGVSPTNVYADMKVDDGNFRDLEMFAEHHGLAIRRKDESIFLYDRKVTIQRQFPDEIFTIQDVVDHLNMISALLYDASVKVEDMQVQGKIYSRVATVSINQALPDDIALFAESLSDLPVLLLDVNGAPDGDYLKMSIKLAILGDNEVKS